MANNDTAKQQPVVSAHIFVQDVRGPQQRFVTLSKEGGRYTKRLTIPVEEWAEFKELVNGFDPDSVANEVVYASDLRG